MAETGTEMSSSPKQFTGHARDPKRKDRPHRHTRTHTPGQMEGPWKSQTLQGSGREQNGRDSQIWSSGQTQINLPSGQVATDAFHLSLTGKEAVLLKSPCFRWRATHPQVGPVS